MSSTVVAPTIIEPVVFLDRGCEGVDPPSRGVRGAFCFFLVVLACRSRYELLAEQRPRQGVPSPLSGRSLFAVLCAMVSTSCSVDSCWLGLWDSAGFTLALCGWAVRIV